MLPDFNRLKGFYYVFRGGGVAAAAKELHVTQSAVSQNLQKLEEELNEKLFIRIHKRLVPTRQGEALFSVIEPFVSNLEEQIETLKSEQTMPGGEFRIGAPVEFGEIYLIQACAEFRKQYTNVRFYLEFGHPDRLLPMISRGELDIAYADIFSRSGEYARELELFDLKPVFSEKLILFGSKAYIKQKKLNQPDFKQLISCDYIAYQRHTPAIRSWFRHHFNKTSINIKPVLTVESVKGVISGLKNNLGLGIVPSHLIQKEIDGGEILPISIKSKELVNHISLIRLLDKIPSLTEKKFLHHFNKRIKSAFDSPSP
jgi:DNA-binding transcriptional LysR family regulator